MSYPSFKNDMSQLETLASEVGKIYASSINSPFLRRITALIEVEDRYMQVIRDLERMINSNSMYDIPFFYEVCTAFAIFCDYAYFKVSPGMVQTVFTDRELERMGLSGYDRELAKILISSFPNNIKQLATKCYQMYELTSLIDGKNSGKQPSASRLKENSFIESRFKAIMDDVSSSV
jgi:hypothetical protein